MPQNTESSEQYSSLVGLIYVFNLIVGTGALTLPAEFAGAGWFFSTVLVILLAFVSFVTVTFVIECMACANACIQWRKIQSHKIDESEAQANTDSDVEEAACEETAIISVNRIRRRYYNLNTKVELGQIATLFFNKTGRTLFFLSLCIYLYGDLAIYTAAVSKTAVDLTCHSNNSSENFDVKCWETSDISKMDVYRIYVTVFALLAGPFTYFNIQKTKYLQIFTTTMRWSAFTIMITLAAVRLGEYGRQGDPKIINLTGLPALIGSSVYSFMCHHSLPGLISPFSNKQHLFRQLSLDYVLICSFYLLLAMTGCFAFKSLEDLYTLNFIPSDSDDSNVFMCLIYYFLGAFPVFTLSTSFPIIAITLQNNLKALMLDVNFIERYNFVLRRLTFPTLAVVPPVIVALYTHNLKTLVEITGSYAGVLIQYVIPAVLVYYARKYCARYIGNGENRYSSPFKHKFWIMFVIGWSVLCVIFVTVNFSINGL